MCVIITYNICYYYCTYNHLDEVVITLSGDCYQLRYLTSSFNHS